MKVYKFKVESVFYAISGKDKQEALDFLIEDLGIDMNNILFEKEIPKEKWNEKIIDCWEDNDMEKEPFKISINDIIDEKEPMVIFTNDYSIFN